MSWETLPPEERAAAERVCTRKEIEALKLKAAGFSPRSIAEILNLNRSTVRERLRNAARKINAELERG